jgi:hypothetical protein
MWTTAEHAIGEIDLSPVISKAENATIVARAPVLTPQLNCQTLDRSHYQLLAEPLGHKGTILELHPDAQGQQAFTWGITDQPNAFYSFTQAGITAEYAFTMRFAKTTSDASLFDRAPSNETITDFLMVECIPDMYL